MLSLVTHCFVQGIADCLYNVDEHNKDNYIIIIIIIIVKVERVLLFISLIYDKSSF